jgi:hypothetical protein
MKPERPRYTAFHLLALFALLFSFAAGIAPAHATSVAPAPAASHTAEPARRRPAGSYWEYKVALNGAWDENYGAGAQRSTAARTSRSASPTRPTSASTTTTRATGSRRASTAGS